MDYFQYIVRVTEKSKLHQSDQDWAALLPPTIDYAEQRIYRELDVLNTRITSTTTTVASSGRSFTLSTSPQGPIIVVESMSAVSSGGVRYQMVPVTKEFVDAVYPNTSTSINGIPAYFAPVTDQSFLIGPPANATYNMEIMATIRPASLSSANSSTFLTQYCPDLFMAASMVYLVDSAEKIIWETEYQKLFLSAGQEQLRQRYEGSAWTPMIQAPVQPPRV